MSERLRILEQVESGEISAAEGARRLEEWACRPGRNSPEGDDRLAQAARPPLAQLISRGVLWSGVAVLCGGAVLVASVYAWGVASGWQIAGWVLFALGLASILLGVWLGRVCWLALRIQRPGKAAVALALPVPLGGLVWAGRALRPWVPQLRDPTIADLAVALQRELGAGQPLLVDVYEGEGGEPLRVSLG